MHSSLLLPLAAGNSFAEALVVFLGLLVYVVPALLRAAKEKREKGQGTAPGRKPGRRPGRRAARGGGMFTGEFNGPQAPGGGSQPPKNPWRELLEGRPSTPPPVQRAPTTSPVTTPAAQPMPPPMPPPLQTSMRPPLKPSLASNEGDLVQLEHTIDDLHETLDRRHEQLEQTRARLPSESQDSVLVRPRLARLPSEDSLETQLSPQAPIIPQRPVTRVASLARAPGAWRHAVVLSEILARPIALRPPSEAPGRLPG